MKRNESFILASMLLMMLAFLTVGAYGSPDISFTERFSGEGSYDIVAGGVGLKGVTTGDITLSVPGAVVKAYLYWSGSGAVGDGDDTVSFSVNGGSATVLTADDSYGPEAGDGAYLFVYIEDVTSLVMPGSHTYTVSNLGMDNNFGAGIMVVYEDAALPNSLVFIYDGLDWFYYEFTDPMGPNSEVVSIQFPPTGYARGPKFIFFAGGVEPTDRPNAIWYQTGDGPKPTDLVDEPSATELDGPPSPYPLGSYDGEEWDTYSNSITVNAGESWACFQIESVDDVPEESGTSCLWTTLGFVINHPPPVGGEIVPNSILRSLVQLTAMAMLIAMVAGTVVYRRHNV